MFGALGSWVVFVSHRNLTFCGNLGTIKGASMPFGVRGSARKRRAPTQEPRRGSCSFAVGAIASVGRLIGGCQL